MSLQNEQRKKNVGLLADKLTQFRYSPLAHARYCYPWGEKGTVLEGHTGPRDWQRELFNDIEKHLMNPATRHTPLKIAIASGHGIGKSAAMGMLIRWALDTKRDTRIVVTANTDSQLKSKTVPEVTKWANMALTADFFNTATTAIYSKDPKHVKSWRCDFVPWSKDNSEAFAGLHNEGRRIILMYDEGSAIDDVIWEVSEGALTDANTEIIWLAFGNPTRNVGMFRECFRLNKAFWKTRQIDSRTVEGTNKELFDGWEKQYGVDSDFFKVRVLGQFPSMSDRQLFDTGDVDRAYGRDLNREQYEFAPIILSCDPAWEGDDELVISKRQGLHFEVLETMAKNTNDMEVGNKIALYEDRFEADAVFIDGGYGTGIISSGRTMGREWTIVWFNGKSADESCMNKRAEMHVLAHAWLKEGGCIPIDKDLRHEMISCQVVNTDDGKIRLLPKKDMKVLIKRSPGRLDSLALTFAFPVAKRINAGVQSLASQRAREYNPHDRLKSSRKVEVQNRL